MASLQKVKNRKESGTFTKLPHHVFKANSKTGQSAPTAVLSHAAARMLENLAAQLNGSNNGDLSAAPKIMALYGWTSGAHAAITELLAYGFIEQTRQGGRNQCSLYAVTWLSIDECGGKLEVAETRTPSNLWKPENAEKIDARYIKAYEKVKAGRRGKLKTVVSISTSLISISTSQAKTAP